MRKIGLVLLVVSLLAGCQSNLKVANKDQVSNTEQTNETIIQVQETHDGSYILKNKEADSKGMNIIFEVSADKGTLSIETEGDIKTYDVQITDNYIINEDGSKDPIEWTEEGVIIYEEEHLEFIKQ